MAEVLVEHDYVAKEPNELTITKGDVIKDVTKKQGGWWEGTLRDKKGLFPDNFVTVISKDSSVVLRNRKDASRIRQCRVVFSYKQDHEDELNLNVGEVIDILGEEEEGWWRGVLNGKEGVFPSNFVEEIVPVSSKLSSSRENIVNSVEGHEGAPPLFAKPAKTLCEVKFSYKAQNEDELTLKEGDLVTLLSKDGQDPGWWKGELNGVVGVFPDNFVTLLPPHAPDTERKHRTTEPASIKPSTINAQRKSLEPVSKSEGDAATAGTKTTPPLPGKKPSIPIKKSPSGSGGGGLFTGLKKKIVDVVDGATGSKISPQKGEVGEVAGAENAFDDVQRRPLLADVRASRPKAPGRRPPSLIGRDPEPGLVNGNSDHSMETVTESQNFLVSQPDHEETKPKVREWAKHPAPWLEEMKLNQAKRSSAPQDKLKLTPTDKGDKDKEPSPIDKSKSITRTETPVVRSKPQVPIPARPQTIHNVTEMYTPKHTRTSPLGNKTPSPMQKGEDGGGDHEEYVGGSKHGDLEQRIARLEELLEKQQQAHEAAIDELRGRLQLEIEIRMKLQEKFETLEKLADSAIQQI